MDNPKKDKGFSLGVVDPITILITESVINKMRTVPYHLKKLSSTTYCLLADLAYQSAYQIRRKIRDQPKDDKCNDS
ncbi:TPA: hypothetical protein ACF4WD_000780 [Streptococcus pyogenes]|nr:hypothetical protein [Streptococcus pyogenes]SUO76160.1 Uncharacterised protein [Streptococcus pyogenes]VGT73469.1 Uncharacterised protein [Streptococcus pyogenes]VHG54520.1 Uncharacterised protein [Streptococcus pyogenes]HEP1375106.1 hypothetical protein [Streptococcus pyogenes]HEQ0655343.1 hypothetical protein [Streptococcus pyogenes]